MDSRTYDVNTGRYYGAGETHGASDRIKADIDRTRGHMDQALDELGRRMQPRRLVDDLLDGILGRSHRPDDKSESLAGKVGSRVSQSLGEHPLPAAVIGAGIAWWIVQSQKERHRSADLSGEAQAGMYGGSYVDARTGEPYPENYGREFGEERVAGQRMMERARERAREATEAAGGRLSSAASSIKESAGAAAGHAQRAASRAGGAISHAASSAAESVGDASSRVAHGAQRAARQARESVSQLAPAVGHRLSSAGRNIGQGMRVGGRRVVSTAHDYPLATGLIIASAGMVVGLLLPSTRREDKLLGRRSDEVKQKARQTGSHLVRRGQEVATASIAAATEETRRQAQSQPEPNPTPQTPPT